MGPSAHLEGVICSRADEDGFAVQKVHTRHRCTYTPLHFKCLLSTAHTMSIFHGQCQFARCSIRTQIPHVQSAIARPYSNQVKAQHVGSRIPDMRYGNCSAAISVRKVSEVTAELCVKENKTLSSFRFSSKISPMIGSYLQVAVAFLVIPVEKPTATTSHAGDCSILVTAPLAFFVGEVNVYTKVFLRMFHSSITPFS